MCRSMLSFRRLCRQRRQRQISWQLEWSNPVAHYPSDLKTTHKREKTATTRAILKYPASSFSRSGIDELAELTDGRRLILSSSSSAPTLPQLRSLSCRFKLSVDRLRITGARDLSSTLASSGVGAF